MRLSVGKSLTQLIELSYFADVPILVRGKHGVGKSESFQQAAGCLGIDIRIFDLSVMEPPDLVGMPKIEKGATTYFPPSSLPRKGKGLILFEEINRCPRHMRAPCLQLLTARSIGTDYNLPKGWLPVAAINPDEGDYHVDELDPALLSRFAVIDVYASVREWVKWAERNDVDPQVIFFVKNMPDIFNKTNPRDWFYVSKFLQAAQKHGKPDHIVRCAIAGLVGDELARAFVEGQADGEILQPDDILFSYEQNREKVVQWRNAGRLDLLRASAHQLVLHTQETESRGERIEEAQKKRFNQFLEDLPGDLAEEYMEAVYQNVQ